MTKLQCHYQQAFKCFQTNSDTASLPVKKSVFIIGRFRVTPSKDAPVLCDHEPHSLNQVKPALHSPPPCRPDQSESLGSSTEGQSESENISMVTVSRSRQRLDYHDSSGGERGDERKRKEEECGEIRTGRRLSVTLLEGAAGSPATSSGCFGQSGSRSIPLISSDESESENEEIWVELQQLRER